MDRRSEERTRIIECHRAMNDIAVTFNSMMGREAPESVDYDAKTNSQLLAEMIDALNAVKSQVEPALKNPVLQMMIRKVAAR